MPEREAPCSDLRLSAALLQMTDQSLRHGAPTIQAGWFADRISEYQLLLFGKRFRTRGDFTKLMVMQEEIKTLPFGVVWNEYCLRCGRPVDGEWFREVESYEKEVLEARA